MVFKISISLLLKSSTLLSCCILDFLDHLMMFSFVFEITFYELLDVSFLGFGIIQKSEMAAIQKIIMTQYPTPRSRIVEDQNKRALNEVKLPFSSKTQENELFTVPISYLYR